MYCRRQTCDYTNKIIKRSTKGKLRIKHQILGHKEFREAAVSSPVTRGNSFSVAQMSGKSCHLPEGLFMVP